MLLAISASVVAAETPGTFEFEPLCLSRAQSTSIESSVRSGPKKARASLQRCSPVSRFSRMKIATVALQLLERQRSRKSRLGSKEHAGLSTWLGSLSQTSRLLLLSPTATGPVLALFAGAVDRLVKAAYQNVCSEKVNYFGQRCIGSFLPDRKLYSKPLLVKLRKSTYKRYKEPWKRLLAFVCRAGDPQGKIQLRHCLTSRQTVLLDQLLAIGLELHSLGKATGWTLHTA